MEVEPVARLTTARSARIAAKGPSLPTACGKTGSLEPDVLDGFSWFRDHEFHMKCAINSFFRRCFCKPVAPGLIYDV